MINRTSLVKGKLPNSSFFQQSRARCICDQTFFTREPQRCEDVKIAKMFIGHSRLASYCRGMIPFSTYSTGIHLICETRNHAQRNCCRPFGVSKFGAGVAETVCKATGIEIIRIWKGNPSSCPECNVKQGHHI